MESETKGGSIGACGSSGVVFDFIGGDGDVLDWGDSAVDKRGQGTIVDSVWVEAIAGMLCRMEGVGGAVMLATAAEDGGGITDPPVLLEITAYESAGIKVMVTFLAREAELSVGKITLEGGGRTGIAGLTGQCRVAGGGKVVVDVVEVSGCNNRDRSGPGNTRESIDTSQSSGVEVGREGLDSEKEVGI